MTVFFYQACVWQISFSPWYCSTEKPEVVVITGSHTVNQGSDLDLTCVVTGIPRPIILWQFSGVLVVPSQDGRISFPELDSLHVKFMTGQDAGDYKCIAENAVGTSSMVANVLVRREWEMISISVSRVSCQRVPYPPCLRMADRALLAGYPRFLWIYYLLMHGQDLWKHCIISYFIPK